MKDKKTVDVLSSHNAHSQVCQNVHKSLISNGNVEMRCLNF